MTLIGCKNPVKTQPALQTQVTNTSKENDCLHQKENDKAGVIRENFEYYNFYKLKKEEVKKYSGTCTEGDCKNGKGKMTFPSGSFYEGDFKDGTFNGYGLAESCSLYRFEGEFINGFAKRGKSVFPGGIIAEGELDIKTGNYIEGKFTYPDGTIVEGKFDKDTQTLVQGKATFPNGTIAEGKFDKNTRTLVQGKATYPNGTIEEGKFDKDTQTLVQGKATYPNGTIEEGFRDRDTKKLTIGKRKYPDGTMENGTFDKDGNHIDLELPKSQVMNSALKTTFFQWQHNKYGCVDEISVTFENTTDKKISNVEFFFIVRDGLVIRYKKKHTVKVDLDSKESSPSPYFKLGQELCYSDNAAKFTEENELDVIGYK